MHDRMAFVSLTRTQKKRFITAPTSLPSSRILPASEVPILRWGILGSGWIAERFIEAVRASALVSRIPVVSTASFQPS